MWSNTLLDSQTTAFSITSAVVGLFVWQHFVTSWTTPANTNYVIVKYNLYSVNGLDRRFPRGKR